MDITYEAIMDNTGTQDYKKKFEIADNFNRRTETYGSLVMDAVILCFAIYFIKIKRWQRFEWTIIVCMFLKYTLLSINYKSALYEWIHDRDTRFIIFVAFYRTLGPICHWIYCSQYLKTCFSIQSIGKRAILLFQRHKIAISNNYQQNMKWDDFIRNHQEIDKDMKKEKVKGLMIHRIFIIIDMIIVISLLSIEGFLNYKKHCTEDSSQTEKSLYYMIVFFPPIMEIIFSLLLVLSACYIGHWIKQSTKGK